MTSLHKISKNSFQNRVFLCLLMGGHFWPLEARKREKPYCVDQKSFINLKKTYREYSRILYVQQVSQISIWEMQLQGSTQLVYILHD